MRAEDFLTIFQPEKQNPSLFKIGTIPGDYSAGLPTIIFDGESQASQKQYPCLASYSPVAGDRVVLAAVSNGYVILGKIGTGGESGYLTKVEADGYYASTNHNHDTNYLKKGILSPIPFYIRGTGLNRNAAPYLIIGETEIYSAQGRGLRFTKISKSNLSIVSSVSYDTFQSTVDSDNLANALNALTYDEIGVLTSYDAWESAVTANLDNAFSRLGLFKASYHNNAGSRDSYAAIFHGSGDGTTQTKSAVAVEVLMSESSVAPYAEICGWFMNGMFVAMGSAPNVLVNTRGDIVGYAVNEDGTKL